MLFESSVVVIIAQVICVALYSIPFVFRKLTMPLNSVMSVRTTKNTSDERVSEVYSSNLKTLRQIWSYSYSMQEIRVCTVICCDSITVASQRY